MKTSFAEMLQRMEDETARKMAAKVPEWDGVAGIRWPSKLSTEQCSSSQTARLKAALGRRIAQERGAAALRVADLTGGLGVDSWAFAQVAEAVLYNERDAQLCEAVRANFAALGLDGRVTLRCAEVAPGRVRDALGAFRPSLLYLDPARRSATGRKVFRLEDCAPDVLALQDELLGICPDVLLKLSPMADLTQLARQFGPSLREIYVVGAAGECKELLCRLDADWSGGYTVVVCQGGAELRFDPAESSPEAPAPVGDGPAPLLYEPGAALQKAGAFRALARRFGIRPLSHDTHLFWCEEPVAALAPFGRYFQVEEIRPLTKASLRQTGRDYPHCEVTARGIPLRSDELRARLGAASGADAHIFGVTLDGPVPGRFLLITHPLPSA